MSKPETEKILGIDLGTTNSAAAINEAGRPLVIPSGKTDSRWQDVPLSSRIHEGWSDDCWRASEETGRTNAEGTIQEIKRKMGSDYKSPRLRERLHSPTNIRLHTPEDQAGH